MMDGGYRRPELWLSEGWDTVLREEWSAPLYWHRPNADSDEWSVFTMRGDVALPELMATPVCNVSYFEAEAYARWSGKQGTHGSGVGAAASGLSVEGNLLEGGRFHPCDDEKPTSGKLQQMFGDVWEWTRSPYIGYPGYQTLPGALGE